MVEIAAHRLTEILSTILEAAATPPDIAQYVAASLVESNLKGVDSHGAVRVSMYVDQILEGYLQPAARPELVQETATTAIVRGHLGFGIFALGYALDLAMTMARSSHVAAVGLRENTHTGRIGQFVERAAAQHMFAMITGGGGNKHARHATVTPFGGVGRIMATNPLAFGLPGGRFGSVVVDASTSATAEGKLRVYRATGEPLPAGWILDKAGNPSTDPEDFYAGGVILPAAGHKGYGLALVAELLGDALLGEPYELNWLVLVIDIAAFRPVADYTAASEELLERVKAVPPAAGFERVLIPGEPEHQTAARRRVAGIPIPDEIWQQIERTAARVGVAVERP